MDVETSVILERLDAIQKEIEEIKKILRVESGKPQRSLYGILEGMKVTDEDIEAAKRSLFKAAYDEDI
jgi:hypothetical protein